MSNVNQYRFHWLHLFNHWNKSFYKIKLWLRRLSILVITCTLERFGVVWFQDWRLISPGTSSVQGTAWYSRNLWPLCDKKRTFRWDEMGEISLLTVHSLSVVEEVILTGFHTPPQLQILVVYWSVDLKWNCLLGVFGSSPQRLGKYTFLEASSPFSFPPYMYYKEIFKNPDEKIQQKFFF